VKKICNVLILILLLSAGQVSALDRCLKYKDFVVRHSRYFFGLNAPVHYFMGQVEQESRCNEGITAFDGGIGLMQLMPATVKQIQGDWMVQFSPYSPEWNIRAGIYWDKQNLGWVLCKDYYFMFRAYNGGAGNLNKEIRNAGSCKWDDVEKKCKRGGVYYVGKNYVDFCTVNIRYPYLIFKKSERYRIVWK